MIDDRRVELIRDGFEMWERGDVEATLALYDPEIEVFAPPEIGNSGTFHGTEGFMQWVQAWLEAWESFDQHLREIEVIGRSHALAMVTQVGVGKGSGIKVERDATYVWEIRGDKLVYMAIFFDHDAAVALAREREADAGD